MAAWQVFVDVSDVVVRLAPRAFALSAWCHTLVVQWWLRVVSTLVPTVLWNVSGEQVAACLLLRHSLGFDDEREKQVRGA